MKRERDQADLHSIAMANCLMLLSEAASSYDSNNSSPTSSRVFECKTCNRQFSSFQALGGHRASHKKPRMMMGGGEDNSNDDLLHGSSPAKPKTHECSICGLEFAIGQALGGHMRRHRAPICNNNNNNSIIMSSSSGNSSVECNSGIKKSKRVLFLDLNLTPFENDLEFLGIGKATPLVDCFY